MFMNKYVTGAKLRDEGKLRNAVTQFSYSWVRAVGTLTRDQGLGVPGIKPSTMVVVHGRLSLVLQVSGHKTK